MHWTVRRDVHISPHRHLHPYRNEDITHILILIKDNTIIIRRPAISRSALADRNLQRDHLHQYPDQGPHPLSSRCPHPHLLLLRLQDRRSQGMGICTATSRMMTREPKAKRPSNAKKVSARFASATRLRAIKANGEVSFLPLPRTCGPLLSSTATRAGGRFQLPKIGPIFRMQL